MLRFSERPFQQKTCVVLAPRAQFTQDVEGDLRANPLLLLAICGNTPIESNVSIVYLLRGSLREHGMGGLLAEPSAPFQVV